jgi:hypothetical protein
MEIVEMYLRCFVKHDGKIYGFRTRAEAEAFIGRGCK